MSVVGIWGEDKSCKSTLALSAPKPIAHLSFDVGGFERACRDLPHLPIRTWYKQGLIVNKNYVMPFQVGKVDLKTSTIIPSKIIVGIKELFYQWLYDYMGILTDNKQVLAKLGLKQPVTSVIIDTATLLYNTIICDGYLQELQERQLKPDGTLIDPRDRLRVQLQQMEYREPYDRMRGIVYQAKATKKNLILTHHASDEFKPMPQKDGGMAMTNTGKRERHGWKQLGDSVDLMVQTFIKQEPILDANGKPTYVSGKPKTKGIPYCKVELCSVLELMGMEMREPTYDMMANMIKMIRGEE